MASSSPPSRAAGGPARGSRFHPRGGGRMHPPDGPAVLATRAMCSRPGRALIPTTRRFAMSKERTLVVLVATDAFLAFSVCGVEAFFQWTLPSPLREFVGGSGHPSFRQFGMLWLWGLTAACAITAWI